MPLLAKHGVETLDGRALALDLKKTEKLPMFPRSGFHWNYYSSFRATQALASRLEGLTGKKLNHLKLDRVDLESKPRGTDGDLSFHAYLWWPSVFYRSYPYPVASKEPVPGAVVPNVLLIGDSFLTLPRHWLVDFGIASEASEHNWYFQAKIEDPERGIFGRDVVILGMNEGLMGGRGYGLIETVLTGKYQTHR